MADNNEGKGMRIFNSEMMLLSARSSGYKDAAMALGELIDNSLQAGATKVDVLVSEKNQKAGSSRRRMWQVQEIAVLDNGCGMDPILQQRALRFGDGEHHNDSSGMGKFGLGLPQASISQAKRVDVWAWQNGIKSAKHTYIDLTNSEWMVGGKILPADDKQIPKTWIEQSGKTVGKSGTLVVWSVLDKLHWRKASSIYAHSEFLVGRMYRNWLTSHNKGKSDATIRLVSFHIDEAEDRDTWVFSANDPLYLLPKSAGMKSSTKRKILFEPWGEPIVKTYQITDDKGEERVENVEIKFSLAPKELREPHSTGEAGSLDYGKHAKKNIGVSIVRAGRELELDSRFGVTKDPRNRWWGAQIEFGPGMDEIFGVTNSKQRAENLSDASNKDWEDESDTETNETAVQTKKRLKDENYPFYICLDVATTVANNINKMMRTIEKSRTSSKSGRKKRHVDSPERKGTEATKQRKEETGKEGDSDPEEELSKEERMEKLKEFLENAQLDQGEIQETIGDIVDAGLKYSFAHAHMDNSSFFSVDGVAGAIVITLNTGHAAYNELFDTLGADTSGKTPQELNQMLLKANSAVLLMLIAWARLEDEASSNAKIRYKDNRDDWGRITRDFLLFGKE